MAVKLSDVAEKAGVSLTTASRVINHDKTMNVSKETEDKIWFYVQELGYKAKKRTQKNKSKIKNIGYFITKDVSSFEDKFFTEIINGIESELISQNCNLCYALSDDEFSHFQATKKTMLTSCDGVIFIGDISNEVHTFFQEARIPMISMLRRHFNETSSISIDLENVSYSIVNDLIHLGHRNIMFIGDCRDFSYSHMEFLSYDGRFRGYLTALLSNFIEIDPSLLLNVDWDMTTAYVKVKQFLESKRNISAIFAANDRMAIGAMRAIQEFGYRIPEDISIVGCDNIEFSQYINPPLTTIAYPQKELGQEAVRLLLSKLQSDDPFTSCEKNVVFSAKIIERKTIAPFTPPQNC